VQGIQATAVARRIAVKGLADEPGLAPILNRSPSQLPLPAGAKLRTYSRKRLARYLAKRLRLHQTEKFLRVDDGRMKSPSRAGGLAGAKSMP
jgi:hypothetical protein